MSPTSRPTACVCIALPHEPEAARQAVERMAGAAAAVPLDPIVAVAPAGIRLPAGVRRADPPREGGRGALRVALVSLASSSAEAAVIWPATHQDARMETVLALLDAFRRGGAGAVIPTAGGRAGFPVIVGREWWGALTLRDATSVHEAVRSAVPDVRDLQIPDGAARDAAATSRAEI